MGRVVNEWVFRDNFTGFFFWVVVSVFFIIILVRRSSFKAFRR